MVGVKNSSHPGALASILLEAARKNYICWGFTHADSLLLSTNGKRAYFGNSSDLQIYHDGSNSYISETGTGGLIIDAPNTIFQDGKKVVLGTDSDVQLYHDNSHGYISNSTGNLRIQSDALRLRSLTGGENYLKADLNGSVELYLSLIHI